jgi:hydroxyethylthiazole kinase-like uncharacterized protein yjeF
VYILSAQQVKEWDRFTIINEPISSIDLMERAASACINWIDEQKWNDHNFRIFCGRGNNGGDGLAIARMLAEKNYKVSVHTFESGDKGSDEFQINLARIKQYPSVLLHEINSRENFPLINTGEILIDALFGTGLQRPLENLPAFIAEQINHSKALVVSIDLPSGLFPESTSVGNKVVEADHTLTFQCYKLALLMQENAPFIGQVHVLDIGLHPEFFNSSEIKRTLLTQRFAKQLYKPRGIFDHKGHYGHALLLAGSYGKMGAAVLAAKACVHSGIGLLSCYVPKCGYNIMQISVPEAMVITDENETSLTELPAGIEKYDVVGLGPGIGTTSATQHLISFIIKRYRKALVIDADGINCLAEEQSYLDHLPQFSILTPHPKEFDRLFGKHDDDFSRMATAEKKAVQLGIIIILKSHHTLIATPEGKSFFNSTGNAGMAKGGSGDVLTGMLTAFLCRYTPVNAAILATYVHGSAGDHASILSQEVMTASDLISFLPSAFFDIYP